MAQIVNALIWAGVMLVTAWLLHGSEQASTVLLILITGASSTLLLIDGLRDSGFQP